MYPRFYFYSHSNPLNYPNEGLDGFQLKAGNFHWGGIQETEVSQELASVSCIPSLLDCPSLSRTSIRQCRL